VVMMSTLFPNNPAYKTGPGTCAGKYVWDPVVKKCGLPTYVGGHPLSKKNKAATLAAAGGGALGSTSTSVLAGIQASPEIRKWGYGGSVTAPKAQGPGGGIVLIGIGAVFLFMFTQKKRKKKR